MTVITAVQGTKYRWLLSPVAEQETLRIACALSLSVPVVQLLMARGYDTQEKIEQFLFTDAVRDVPHPSLMKDLVKAVDRILLAIERGEKILVAGDYDVDGITSSAMMLLCLAPLGATINYFLPNRLRDGYGLSCKTIQRAADNGYTVVVTVDNGITAFEPALLARQLGVDLIITDHHRPHAELPAAYAIVDPAQQDCPYPYKPLAGVGVTFKVLSLLYERQGKELPARVYELLLLGTVADVVPLTGENRYWVRHCLRIVNANESLPITVLKTNGKVAKPELTSADIGFNIAPQINALGRLEDARQGVKFLLGDDPDQTNHVGQLLLQLNQARKEIERAVLDDVLRAVQEGAIDTSREMVVLAASNAWQPGVIGLVAARLVATFARPAILLHMGRDGIAKGSCRSIPGFNIFDALEQCKDLLIQFGGHSMAAGLSLRQENVPQFKERLEGLMAQRYTMAALQLQLVLDAKLSLSEVTAKLVADIEHLEPFGSGNPTPAFMIPAVTLAQPPRLLKEQHVKCMVVADGVIKPTIFFNRPELYQQLLQLGDRPFNLAAQVTKNYWNDMLSIELHGIDISVAPEL